MKFLYKKSWLLLFISICSFQNIQSNNLSVNNLVLNQAAQEITFDLAWNNSWRFDGLATPQNWDAAWVFVKFKSCPDCQISQDWIHGVIDTTAGTFGALQPHSTDGGQFYDDMLGVMLRQNTQGLFPNSGATTVTLRLSNMPLSGGLEVKVIGIEMVYVPTDAYYLGDGGSTGGRFYEAPTNTNPYLVSSEAAITVENSATNLWATGATPCCAAPYTIPATFPKGYNHFYMMKYEVTEGQYSTFMNTIPSGIASNRYVGSYNTYRQRLNNTGVAPDIYVAERPDRALSYMSPQDLFAYLDWAALRPHTEFEYEKAARGPVFPVVNEYAWGSTTINQARNINPAALEDGTELVDIQTDANCNYGFWAKTGGDYAITANWNDQYGPVRVGIFADGFDTSRVQTGASYYGIMELSGNVSEICIGLLDINNAPIFDGAFGNGYVDGTGSYDAPNWPPTGGFDSDIHLRGGSWGDGTGNIRTSYRNAYTSSKTGRNQYYGGRGGR